MLAPSGSACWSLCLTYRFLSLGIVYYFNTKTGESRWEPPTDTFPSVYLKPSRRRKAEAKQAEYYKQMQKEEKKKSFVTKLLERNAEEEQLKEEEEPEWMKGMLEEKYATKEEEKPGLFARLLNKEPTKQQESTRTSVSEAAPTESEEARVEAPSEEAPKKNIFDNIFASMTASPSPAPERFFMDAQDNGEEIAKQAEEEKKAAEAKAKEEEKRKKEEDRKKAEEERKMVELVRKAEAEQKAEADRLEAEAKRVIEEARKAEQATKKAEKEAAKAAAAEAKKAAAEAKKVAVEAKKEEEEIIVEEKQAPIKIDIGSCVLPHPSKVMWGGEDAIFTKGRTFGVFDGVSGADKMDGLPLYSKMLARQMTQLVGDGTDLTIKDLQDQLLTAAEIADERATGASTAVVASITENGYLRAISLGDSYCIVIRGEKVVAKTKEIVHYFDCPYQLSDISPDRPRDARKLNFELVRGDIILMGSDGIFDNLEDSEIVEIATSSEKASAIAKKVSDRSRKVSLNSQAATPYSKQAKKNGDPDFKDGLGGKVDDISCVVARYE